jgi:hypothetical protein
VKLLFFLTAVSCLALSTFRGIQPGVSTRVEAERALGRASAQRGPDETEYTLADKSGVVLVKYRADIADEIEYRLAAPLERAEVVSVLQLPGDAMAIDPNPRTRLLEEFFDGAHTLILVHVTESRNSAIGALRYLTREGFDREKARFAPSTPPETPPVTPPPPPTVNEQRVRYDPSACRDIYEWARGEVEPANKSKNAERKQSIIEIRINAQKGDCALAGDLVKRYRSRFK